MTSPHTPIDLLWALWSALGVPGTVQGDPHLAIDPEPLVLYTPWLTQQLDDPRLEELSFAWLVHHGHTLNPRRLKSLSATVSPTIRAAWAATAAELADVYDVHLPGADSAAKTPWASRELRKMALPEQSPPLVWFRARRLFGRGSRADLACALLARHEAVSISDLTWLGYTRRAVDDTLTDWMKAGVVRAFRHGPARLYTLTDTAPLQHLLGAEDMVWVDTRAMLTFLSAWLDLRNLDHAKDITRRVAAAALQRQIRPLADRRRLAMPQVDGEADGALRMLDFLDAAWKAELAPG